MAKRKCPTCLGVGKILNALSFNYMKLCPTCKDTDKVFLTSK